MGRGQEKGGQGQSRGRGPGRMGGPKAAGPGGNCLCPNCGHTVLHKAGKPCYVVACPKCGAQMMRD